MEGETSKTYMFGSDSNLISLLVPLLTQRGIDPSILYSMNGGLNGGNFIWLLFLLFFWGGNGNFGNGFGNNGTGFLANQLNNDAGRDLLLQAIQGNGNAIGQLATNLNSNFNAVQSGITSLLTTLQSVGSQVGMSGLQVQNAIQSGDAALSHQLCECCCENRLLTTQQGYEAQIRTIEQTNQLGSQADRNTASIVGAINGLHTDMTREFCEVKEREQQAVINRQAETITQLRGQIDNAQQTAQIASLLAPIQAEVAAIKASQPNTVPVQWPNLTAVNNTPLAGGFYGGYGAGFNPWGYGFGGSSYWG